MPPRPTRNRRAPSRLPALALALAAGGWCLAGAPPAGAQEGQPRPPVRLFPPADERPAPTPAPAPGGRVEGAAPLGPAPLPEVRVEELGAPSVDAIGLAAPDGLGAALWQGTEPEFALALLRDLPVRTPNPALRALARRLLVSPGPPAPAGRAGEALASRMERLLAMGEVDAVRALVQRLPPGQGGAAAERLAAEAQLLAGDTAAACERAEEGARRFRDPFWTKLVALCRFRARDRAGARLAADLLREAAAAGAGGAGDPAFFTLFDLLAAGRGRDEGAIRLRLGPGEVLSPLHIALLREAGVAVPDGALGELDPAHLAAIARDPKSAPGLRVAAAELAAAAGALPPDELPAVYTGAGEFSDVGGRRREADAGPAADDLDLVAANPEGRARLYRALAREGSAALWADAAAAAWRAADDPRLRLLLARTFASPLAGMAPDPGATGAAAEVAALGLLAAGHPGPARDWAALVGGDRGAALRALFGLVDARPPDAEALAAWRGAGAGAGADWLRLLALFDGLGTPAPDAAWHAAVVAPPSPAGAGADAEPTTAAAWQGLRRAAAAGRPGEAALLALHLLDGRPGAAHPVALADAVDALRRVGLEREGRGLAIGAALALAAGGRG